MLIKAMQATHPSWKEFYQKLVHIIHVDSNENTYYTRACVLYARLYGEFKYYTLA